MRSAADALTGLCPGELPDAALSELLLELDAEWNRLAAGRVALLGVWDARVAWAGDGAQSGAGWVAARTEQARGAVSSEIRVARGLRAMPVTEKAFLSGDLGFAKVRLLVDLAKDLPDAYAEAEAFLVERVQTVRVDQVPIVLARWRAFFDSDGEGARAATPSTAAPARSTAPRRPKPTPTAPRSRAPPRNAATTPCSSSSSKPPPQAIRATASTCPPSPPSSTSPSSPTPNPPRSSARPKPAPP
jgi:hypothetical protein